MIDVNAPKEHVVEETVVEQAAKRARDDSFKPAIEEDQRGRELVRRVLTKISKKHLELGALVRGLCPEKNGEFIREVECMFSLSFSETFCAIGDHAKSK